VRLRDSIGAWRRLSGGERACALMAAAALSGTSVLRRGMPARFTRRLLTYSPLRSGQRPVSPARVVGIVDAVSARLPLTTTCLDRAIAARWILGWHGVRATLVIGTSGPEPFDAHAWLDCSDTVGDTAMHHVLWHSR
jgi:hypothetical protein